LWWLMGVEAWRLPSPKLMLVEGLCNRLLLYGVEDFGCEYMEFEPDVASAFEVFSVIT